MSKRAPMFVALDHDDAFAKYVGNLADKRQFFLTKPYLPAPPGQQEHDYLALYIVDEDGALLEARIEDLGLRDKVDVEKARGLRASMLASLGKYTPSRIFMVPFHTEKFGVEFGLVAHAPKRLIDEWHVTVEPGHYMTFSPPWDSGEYDV